MLRSALTGMVAALVVLCAHYLSYYVGGLVPSFVLLVALGSLIFGLLWAFKLYHRWKVVSYSGLPNLMVHLLFPSSQDTPLQWMIQGILSFTLVLSGGIVGYEGPAVELSQSFCMKTRPLSARWFELKRRTDAAASLAGGVSAAFGAPFAGILLPMELGIGGRGISVVVSSVAAFLTVRLLGNLFSVQVFTVGHSLDSLNLTLVRGWGAFGLIGLIAGVLGILSVHFIRFAEEGFAYLFNTHKDLGKLLVFGTLVLILFIYSPSPTTDGGLSLASPVGLLQNLYSFKISWNEWILLFGTRLCLLALVLAGVGTIGVVWPLFILGNLVGFFVDQWILGGAVGSPLLAGLIGGTAFLGAALGVPVTAALLSFEFTQDFRVLLICLLVAALGQQLRKLFRARPALEHVFDSQKFSYREGRSVTILDSITVKDAIVTDHQEVYEHETVAELHEKLQKSKYPFVIVVNAQGVFKGLLTVDSIEEGWREQNESLNHQKSLATILEAKDLLYRSRFKSPTVRITDKLTVTSGIFEQAPCVPVLGDGDKAVGLLFVYSVRLVYDREVARRSFSFMREGKG